VQLDYPQGEQRVRTDAGEVAAFASLRRATFQPADGPELAGAGELKIAAHTVTHDQGSRPLPAAVEVHLGDETRRFELELSGGELLLPLTDDRWQVEIAPVGVRARVVPTEQRSPVR
jgi:hypothetical protein